MNQTPEQSPADQALLKAAAEDEQNALNNYLQGRVVMLNAEVRRRDQIIQGLEQRLALLEPAGEPVEPEVAPEFTPHLAEVPEG